MSEDTVIKESLYIKKEKLTFAALVVLFLFFLFRYIFWWFQPQHVPSNWQDSGLHFLDLLIFALLSFVAFISAVLHIGSWFSLWHAAKPKNIEPEIGLRVAFSTCFVPGKEPIAMLVNTLRAMKNVRYPHTTWVLDEGDSEEVERLCRELDVEYFTRKGVNKYNQNQGRFRTKTKAGNHNAWADLYAKYYDIVAQIDMDHVPEPEFFEKTLGYFKDPEVGFVGMPQFYKNTDNWIAKGAAEQSFFFHGPMQQGFYGCDMPFLIGTSHIYRTTAMEKIGGYAPTIVEDHLTGMNFYAHGFKGVFVPEVLARGDGPLNWIDYFNQQMRWSYGLFEIFFKHTPKILLKLKWKQKINYLFAQLYYFSGVAVVAGFVLTFVYLVFGIRATSMDLFEWLRFAAPPFLAAITLQIYTHRFSIDPDNEPVFGILGMFLNLGANLIYATAFVKFICGQKLKYIVTQKGVAGQQQRVPLKTFNLHQFFAALMLFAFIDSFFTHHTAIQLRFWALFNVVTLNAVILSVYWKTILAGLNFFRIDLRLMRLGLGFAVEIVIFIGLIAIQSQYGGAVRAYFDKQYKETVGIHSDPQFILDKETPLAGKVLASDKGVYLGVSLFQHNDTDYLNSLQDAVSKKFAIVGYYQSWGVKENKFDKIWAKNIAKNGSTPLITWEPWEPISGFDRSESKVDQKQYRLKNITSGQYDDYIREYAEDIRSYKGPVMIRFAHEMNGNWYPWGSTFNDPGDYVLAWRHVHEIFDSVDAANVTWVWSPNEAYVEAQVPNAGRIELFYPGDDYVDWVGFSAFNWAGTYKHNLWRSPEDLYGFTFSELKRFNKPIMITETASAESGNDTPLKGKWISELAKYIENNPEIKGLVWFNTEDNGVNWTLGSSANSINAFKESFGSYFLQSI